MPLGRWVENLYQLFAGATKKHRLSVNLPYKMPQGFEVKLASTSKEFTQAFKLLHDVYADQRKIRPSKSRQMITLHYMLPTTSFIVAKWKDDVIGVIAIIKDNPLGLPIDKKFPLDDYKSAGLTVAEISPIAYDQKWEGDTTLLVFSLLKYMVFYAKNMFAVDTLVLESHKTNRIFYKHVLLFESLRKKDRGNYGTSEWITTEGLVLDLRKVYSRYNIIYGSAPRSKNLARFMAPSSEGGVEFPGMHYPHRAFHQTWDTMMSPTILEHFLRSESNAFRNLKVSEKQYLFSVFRGDAYNSVLDSMLDDTVKNTVGADYRFPVLCSGYLEDSLLKNNPKIFVDVVEASYTGLKVRKTSEPIVLNKTYKLSLNVGPRKKALLRARAVWSSDQYVGFEVMGCDQWRKMLDYMEKQRSYVANKSIHHGPERPVKN